MSRPRSKCSVSNGTPLGRGQLRNGTTAVIANVDPQSGSLDLRLADGTELRLGKLEIAKADLRLAYVQHPFPA